MKKKWLAFWGLVSVCICLLVCIQAQAEATSRAQNGVTPRIVVQTSGATISGRGTCPPPSGCTASVTVYIQKQVNGTWATISSNSGSNAATVSATMQHGFSYRAYVYCRVYDAGGSLFDTGYSYSSAVNY